MMMVMIGSSGIVVIWHGFFIVVLLEFVDLEIAFIFQGTKLGIGL